MHGLPRGYVDRRDARRVPGVLQDICRRIGVVRPHISQEDMLADTDSARDSLADLPSPDDDDHASHGESFRECTRPKTPQHAEVFDARAPVRHGLPGACV